MQTTGAATGGRRRGATDGEVVVDKVTKCFVEDEKAQVCLEDCSLRVPAGSLTVVMGPSGCGKTALINLIAGYDEPDAGTISIGGRRVAGPGPDRLVVFQETALFPWMTVYKNVSFGCRVKGMPAGEIKEKTEYILAKVGLSDFRDKYPSQLSGGMQRRAELARALINEPKLMILDEPFRGLDAMTRELMQEFYLGLFEETRITTLFVTHELEEAIFMADRLVILTYKPGKVKEVIDIDLERPRHFSVMATKRYLDLYNYAIALLFEEARKAFAAGSVSAADMVECLRRNGGQPPA
ncbi:MAG: ABC transporter ATP-binding protein [Thermodesulfovibrionales bacterium]